MVKTVRVGVSGHGVSLRLHAPVLNSLGFDAVPVQLPRVEPFSGKVVPGQMDLSGLDLLVVGSPPFAHLVHTAAGIASGIPTICEKPCGAFGATPIRL